MQNTLIALADTKRGKIKWFPCWPTTGAAKSSKNEAKTRQRKCFPVFPDFTELQKESRAGKYCAIYLSTIKRPWQEHKAKSKWHESALKRRPGAAAGALKGGSRQEHENDSLTPLQHAANAISKGRIGQRRRRRRHKGPNCKKILLCEELGYGFGFDHQRCQGTVAKFHWAAGKCALRKILSTGNFQVDGF